MPPEYGPITDFHSHLVPGVDDGAKDLGESLEAVERMVRGGVGCICTTPHLNASLTHDPIGLEQRLGEIDAAWDVVSRAVEERFPGLRFERGCEIMLDVPDPDLSDPRLRLAGTPFVLVEWPRLQIPPRTEHVIERISGDGYRPILAHPERYHGVERELHLVEAWRMCGAFLQVNHGSFAGRYGAEAKDVAQALLSRGWIDYLCSDFHARSHLSVYLRDVTGFLEDQGGQEQLHLLTVSNPGRIFLTQRPLPVPSLKLQRPLWSRFKGMFGA